jgi:hypothetical protein
LPELPELFHRGSSLRLSHIVTRLATSYSFKASSELATIFGVSSSKLCPLAEGIEGWRWAQDTDITIISVTVSELPYHTSSVHLLCQLLLPSRFEVQAKDDPAY